MRIFSLAQLVLPSLALFLTACSPESKKAGSLQSADEHFAQRDLSRAEVEYLNVLKIDPANSHALGRLGLIYAEQGQYSRAFAHLVKSRELSPEDLDVRVRLAQLNLTTGSRKGVAEELTYVLEQRPTDPEAPLLLAGTASSPEDAATIGRKLRALPPPANVGAPVLVALATLELAQQRIPAAEALISQAQAAEATFAPLYTTLASLRLMQGDLSGADEAYRRAAELSPARSSRRLQYAQFKLRANDPAAARKALEAVTREAPDYIPAWNALAEIALTEGNYDLGASLVEKAISRDPANLDGLLIRGRLRLARGDLDQAAAEFDKLASTFPRIPVVHYEVGRTRNLLGESSLAVKSLTQAINLAPTYSEAVMLLASIHQRLGDPSSAIVLLRRLLQQRPDLLPARLMLADILRGQGNLDDALAIYDRIESQTPDSAQIALLRGQVLLLQKKVADARTAFERARSLAPDNPVTLEALINLDLLTKDYAGALERVEREKARNPKVAGPAELLRAKILLAQDDSAAAEVALKKAIELMPDAQAPYLLLAGIYHRTSQQAKALASLEEALQRNPKDQTALMLIGVIQDQEKNHPAAAAAYEKLLAANPRAVAALNNLAYLYGEHLNQLDRAQQLAQKARDLTPSEPHTADTLGWILYKKRLYPRALSLLQEAAEKLPDSAEVLYHLGMAYYAMGQETPAIAALRKATASGTGFTGAAEARRCLELLLIDPAKADVATQKLLEDAIAARKDDPVALARLAAIHERQGNTAKAISLLESAQRANDRNVSVLATLARLYASNREPAKAIETAKAARLLAPDDPAIAHALGRLAFEMGDFSWSASLLQEAARKENQTPELLLDLAWSLYSVGRVEDATRALEEMLQAKSLSLRANEGRQFLDLIKLGSDPAAAVARSADIDHALQADPNLVPALMALAAVRERQGAHPQAREAYHKALQRYPGFTPAMLRIASLSATQATYDQQAYEYALQARTAYPTNPEAARALGILTYYKGDFERAASLLRESSVRLATDPDVWYHLGMAAYRAKSGTGETRTALQRALELNLRPAFAGEARQILAELK